MRFLLLNRRGFRRALSIFEKKKYYVRLSTGARQKGNCIASLRPNENERFLF